MQALPSLRLTANLNSMITGSQTLEQAERAIAGFDVAHHVVDPVGLLGLDPLQRLLPRRGAGRARDRRA